MEPPTKPLIKIKHVDRSETDFVKLEFCRDTISDKYNLYEFNMVLFDNDETEEFLLLVQKFNMTHTASGTLSTGAKIQ